MGHLSSQFGLLFLCLSAGFALRQTGRLGDQAARSLGTVVTSVFLPAVVLLQVHRIARAGGFLHSVESWVPALAGWALFLGAALLFWNLGKKWGWSSALRAAVILSAGLGNTSFIGFPLLSWLRGNEAIPIGIFADQFGAFLPLSTVGVFLAASLGSKKAGLKKIALQILAFPPFAAVLVAGLTMGIEFPRAFEQLLEALSAAMIPTALVSVGAYLKFSGAGILKRYRKPLVWGLAYKLVVAPLALLGILRWGFGFHGLFVDVAVLEVAMAPMISAALVAAEYDCEPELCNLMIALGTPISLLTVPVFSLLLSAWGAA